MKDTTAMVKVTVAVQIEIGSWGPDCTLEQAHRQASESAIGRVSAALAATPGITTQRVLETSIRLVRRGEADHG